MVLLVLLAGVQAGGYLLTYRDNALKSDDSVRISDIAQIRQALSDYYDQKGMYPACLYKADCKSALENSTVMPTVAVDPRTGIHYGYAAFGRGPACSGFHLGISLDRTASQALLTGSDAAPRSAGDLCAGSLPDFSGLSFTKGGQQCDLSVGTPQPTNSADGETCYDLARQR